MKRRRPSMTKGVEDGMGDERLCECGHRRRCHWLRYVEEAGCYRPKECAEKGCLCQQFKLPAAVPEAKPEPPATEGVSMSTRELMPNAKKYRVKIGEHF